MREYDPGTVAPCDGVGYFVRSTTGPYWWLVTGEGCPCPARVKCRHIRSVESLVDRIPPAPAYPAVLEPF